MKNTDASIGLENPAEQAYDKAHGKYQGNVPRTGNAGATLPDMPQGPDPNPFTLGPLQPSGGR